MHWREKLRRIPIGIALLFVMLGAGLGVAGRVYYLREEREFKRSAGNELSTIAEMKVAEILRWRRERGHDAEMLRRGPVVRATVDSVLRGDTPAGLPRNTAEFLGAFREYHGYEQMTGVDRRGAERFSLPGGARKLEAQCAAAAAEALRSGVVAFSDLHRSEGDAGAHFCIAGSIPPPEGRGPAAGAVVLRVAAERFLYPLIQAWPTASRTGETLLVRREGDEVVYLNELRHRKGTALKLRLPVGTEGQIAAMAVKERTGVMEGIDYRGVAAMAAVLPVRGTPWYLVAKADLDELHAPLRERARWLSLVVGLLVMAAATTAGYLWWNQRAGFYRRQYEAEQQHGSVLRTAMDGIAVIAADGRFLEVNDAYCELAGYSRRELLTMRVDDIEPQYSPDLIRQAVAQIIGTGGLRSEAQQRRKDGRMIPIEFSTTYLPGDSGRLVVFVRDITERKRAEEALRASEEEHRTLFETMAQGVVYQDAAGRITSANPAAERILGLTLDQMQGRTSADPRWRAIHEDGTEFPGETHPSMVALRTAEEVRNVVMGVFHPLRNEHVWITVHAVPQFKPGERIPHQAYTTFEDITERKKAEETLREKEEFIRALLETSRDWIWAIDVSGVHRYSNPAVRDILGYELDEVVGRPSFDLICAEDLAGVHAEFRQCVGARRGWSNFVVGWRHKDGSSRFLESSSVPALDAGGNVIGFRGVDRDITERKRAQEVANAERDLGLALSESTSLEQALKHCLASAMAVSGMDSGGVYLANEDGSLDLLVHEGLSQEMVRAASHYPAETSNARLVHTGAPVYLRRENAGLEGDAARRAEGLAATAVLPIRDRGKTVACLNLGSHTREDISQAVRTALERVASRIGPAISRARAEEALRDSQEALARSREELRALAASLLNAQEEERRRVSRELHDDLNQRLAVLAMQVDLLAARLPLPVGELRREVTLVGAQVAGLSDDVRRMASQLHPSVLEHLGLAVALRSHCEQFSSREGIPIAFEERGVPAELSPEIALCLYRIAQEALRNLARHARATRGSVTLAGSEGDIELSITDDGEGFHPQVARARGRLGLLSMEERARLVGGTLAIRSSPGQGTRIEARVPGV